jgi:hypothetical protein
VKIPTPALSLVVLGWVLEEILTEKILLAAVLFASPIFANSIYWYNGDSGGSGNIVDERGGQFGSSFVYDDFNVGAPGVDITGLIATEAIDNATGITQGSWEIRSGISTGNACSVSQTSSVNARADQRRVGSGLFWKREVLIRVRWDEASLFVFQITRAIPAVSQFLIICPVDSRYRSD